MFFKKSQQQLDDALLQAIGKYKFNKVYKLLKQGANIHAVDAEGNTAFHKLASIDYDYSKASNTSPSLEENICLLLNHGIDINAGNKKGQTCLHIAASTVCYYHESMMRTLIKYGAKINILDNSGMAPVNMAAWRGKESIVNEHLCMDGSLIAVKDHEGKYLHDSAMAGGHNLLSRQLLDKLNAYNAGLERVRAENERLARIQSEKSSAPKAEVKITLPEPKPAVPVSTNNWIILSLDQAAHICVEKKIGYKLTEIFNFRTRMYTHLAQNMDTKAEVLIVKSFDEFSDKTLFVEARKELLRMGGQADESAIYGQILDKGKPKPNPPL